jgi:hypothetical protein
VNNTQISRPTFIINLIEEINTLKLSIELELVLGKIFVFVAFALVKIVVVVAFV